MRFNDAVTIKLPMNCDYHLDGSNLTLTKVEVAGGYFFDLAGFPKDVQELIIPQLSAAIREYETERKGAFDGRI